MLFAQYDAGTVIYNQTSTNNLTSISKNYLVEDFDGDFNADVIMIKRNVTSNANYLTWYKGNGAGNFTEQTNLLNIENSHNENEIFFEDMNRDGNKDIIFQNNDTGFTILLNNGRGNITAQINNEVTTDNPFETDLKAVADINGDGFKDGIFWNKIDSLSSSQYLGHCLIGYNNGNGFFTNYVYLDNDEPEMFLQIKTGDMDGDGDVDIICSAKKILSYIGLPLVVDLSIRVFENRGSNNFTLKEIELPIENSRKVSTFFSNIKINDINGDGKDDLFIEFATANLCGFSHCGIINSTPQLQVLNYDIQSKEFTILETYNSWLHSYNANELLYDTHKLYDNAFQMQFGNQNTDNNLDILSINVPQGKLHWYYGDGNGGLNNGQTVNFNSQYSNIRPALRVGDMDNDSDLDVFVLLNDDDSSTLTVFKNLALTPSCAPVLDLANSTLTNGIYQAGTTLISSGKVATGNNNVVLKAGENVQLQNGFNASANSSLQLLISSCN